MRLSLLIYGALNAILYAGLTPLWEGFDEPFHVGYLQHLITTHTLPVQKRTCLSEEIWQSFPLAPASYIVQRNLPMVTTFDDYFRLPQAERIARRQRLEQLDPGLAAVTSRTPNYEAQQAPLAYALLAPFHVIWGNRSLPARVWRLRLLCALASSIATGLLVLRLASLLLLGAPSAFAAVFLVFSSQMFYATTAHVANDWMALPIFLFVLCSGIDLYLRPRPAAVWMLALSLCAGLLTKAYFLAMAPFAFGIVIARRGWRGVVVLAALLLPATPWYIRNVVLYRDVAGLQEHVGGTPFSALMSGAVQVPWAKALAANAKSSLWEGNSSATTFGSTTIWLMLVLLAAGTVSYVVAALRRRPPVAEFVLLAGLGCYAAGLVYNNVVQWVATRGAGITTAPWYVQLLVPPGFCLILAGLARSGRAGHMLRAAMCWTWAYVICATYLAKLIPMYGGYGGRPVRLAELFHWYKSSFDQIRDVLGTTAMISPSALFALTAAVVVGAVGLAYYATGLRSQR